MITAWRSALSAAFVGQRYLKILHIAEGPQRIVFVEQHAAEVGCARMASARATLQKPLDARAKRLEGALQPAKVAFLLQVAAVQGDHLTQRGDELLAAAARGALSFGDLDRLADEMRVAKLLLQNIEEVLCAVAVRDQEPAEVPTQELLGRRLRAVRVDPVAGVERGGRNHNHRVAPNVSQLVSSACRSSA
jgi:hypothetical protein